MSATRQSMKENEAQGNNTEYRNIALRWRLDITRGATPMNVFHLRHSYYFCALVYVYR